MKWDKAEQDRIYKHYIAAFEWLGGDMPEGAGGAFRNLNVIAAIVSEWPISTEPLPIKAWLESIDTIIYHGEVKERSRWVLDSAVGDLLRITDISMGFGDDDLKEPLLSSDTSYVNVPNAASLSVGEMTSEWLLFFGRLIERTIAFDIAQSTLPTNVFDLRALTFHGYLIAMAMHQGLSMVDYVNSWRDQ